MVKAVGSGLSEVGPNWIELDFSLALIQVGPILLQIRPNSNEARSNLIKVGLDLIRVEPLLIQVRPNSIQARSK